MTYYNFTQYVLVEFRNTAPYVEKFISDSPITIEMVAEHYVDTDEFNEDKDAITFIDDPVKGAGIVL